MNKKIFWTTLTLFSLTLTACASIARTTGSAPSGGPSAVEMPAQTKITLGVINLEETDNAISAEQAKELLPMFHVLQDLNDSDTAAQEEKDGLVNQIQEILTAEQVQAIDDMSLSMRDVFALTRGNSAESTSDTASTANMGAGGPPDMGDGMPGGGMPGGGAMPSTGTTSASSDTSVRTAMDISTPSALFDAAIEILQKKVQ